MATQTPEQLAGAQRVIDAMNKTQTGKSYLASLPVSTLSATQPTWPQQSTAQNELSMTSILAGAKNYYTQSQAETMEASKPVDAVTERLRSLMGASATKGEATLGMEKDMRLDDQQNRLNDLMLSINNRTTALEQAKLDDQYDVMNLEGRGGVPIDIVRGQQARMQRDRAYQRQADAIELGGMVATAELMRGNIQTARDAIDRTIGLKYGDIEQAINNEMFFYEQNWNKLTAAQQKEAAARVEMLTAQRDVVNAAKQDEETRFNLQAAAAQAGADSATIEAIKNAPDLAGAATIANRYIGGQAAIDRNLDRSLRGLQMETARAGLKKALTESDDTFRFNGEERKVLLGSGIPQEKVKELESLIRDHGLEDVIEMSKEGDLLTENERAALQSVFGIEEQRAMTADDIALMYGGADSDNFRKAAKDAGYVTGGDDFIPFNEKGDTDAYKTSLNSMIQMYRNQGYTDKEILEMMRKK